MKERPILFAGRLVRAILAGTKTQTRRVITPQPAPFVQQTPDRRNALKHLNPYIDSYCSEPKTAANPRGMSSVWCWWTRDDRQGETVARCRYGVPGDRLWVRETWLPLDPDHYAEPGRPRDLLIETRRNGAGYRAECGAESDAIRKEYGYRWRSSIHMPRWASRLTLEITGVRVERLQDVTEEDARAEGVQPLAGIGADQPILDTVRGRTHGTHPHVLAFAVGWDTLNGKRAPWASNPWVWVIEFRRAA